MAFSNTLSLTVAWGDCAPSGAVFYPNYFRWFDQAVWNFFDAAAMPLLKLEADYGIVGLPLINTEATFKSPCRLRDSLEIESSIIEWSRKTLTMTHLIRNGGTLAVEGRDLRFWGARDRNNPSRMKAREIPGEVIEYFQELSG